MPVNVETVKGARSKSHLLQRASLLAILASAGGLSSVTQAQAACQDITTATTISSDVECAQVDGFTSIDGDVVNNATIGPPTTFPDSPAFFMGKNSYIDGQLINNNTITGGFFDGKTDFGGAIQLDDGANISGGILNKGGISSEDGIGIQLGSFFNYGPGLTGNIVNQGNISGGMMGVGALTGTMSGALINEESGIIQGGYAGVYISDDFTSWTGGISNSGQIIGDEAGILVGELGNIGAEGYVDFSGGIVNQYGAEISSLSGPSVAIGGASYSGGFYNYGLITQRDEGAANGSGAFAGTGVVFGTDGDVSGGFYNGGTIFGLGGSGVVVMATVANWNGDFTNANLIDAADTGVVIQAQHFNGSFANQTYASIEGDDIGVFINAGTIAGGFTNEEDAHIGGGSTGVVIVFDEMEGNIANHGTIDGGYIGMAIGEQPVSTFFVAAQECDPCDFASTADLDGDVVNDGTISGTYSGLTISLNTIQGNVSNSGLVEATGGSGWAMVVDVNTFTGNISNSGTIAGGEKGLIIGAPSGGSSAFVAFVASTSEMNGSIENSGFITGGQTGAIVTGGTITGAFTNDGTISGVSGAGLIIEVNEWNGNITNGEGGSISGGITGLFVNVGTMTGDFINDGVISGGGVDTGFHLQASSITGNIVNNGTYDAVSNALHLEIDTLNGDVINNAGALIDATGPGSNLVAVRIEGDSYDGDYQGAFINHGSIHAGGEGSTGILVDNSQFANGITNTGSIQADTAIDTSYASGGMTITNTANGIITGDLRLNVDYSDTFVGDDGGIYGDIWGDGSAGGEGGEGGPDDDIDVTGTHFFIGKVSTIRDFDVAAGGVAVLGAENVGDNGPSPSFYGSNITNYHNNGRTYLDDNATVNVGTFSQASTGELTYFLTTTESQHGSINATGTVTLDGDISVVLDPISFAGGGSTTRTYNNVITGGSINGTFDNEIIDGASYFYSLDVIYDDDNTVDLTLVRRQFNNISCPGGVSGNNNAIGDALEEIFESGDFDGSLEDFFDYVSSLPDGCAAGDAYDEAGGTPLGQLNIIAIRLDDPWKFMVDMRSSFGRSEGCVVAGDTWCFNRYAANTGGSNVMNDATPGEDPFAWLKTGVRETGTTAVWGRMLGVWGETDGDGNAPGTDSNTHGGIVGIDHVFSPTFLAGAAMQYTTTDIDFAGIPDNASIDSFEIGGYFSWGDTSLYLNGNASVIFHDFESHRFVLGDTANGNYDGTTVAAYAELGRIYEVESLRLQPILVLSYASLDTDAYTETGTAGGLLLSVEDTQFESLRSMLGARLAYPIEMKSGRKLVPEARISWSHEYLDDAGTFTAEFTGAPGVPFTVTGEAFSRDSLILGLGMTAPIDESITFYIDYDATLNQDATAQTLSAGLRAKW